MTRSPSWIPSSSTSAIPYLEEARRDSSSQRIRTRAAALLERMGDGR
jgi:hypothetical protein